MGGTSSRQITHETQPGGAWDPQFSPDGSQLMYQINADDKGDSAAGSYSFEIGRDGTNRHAIHYGHVISQSPRAQSYARLGPNGAPVVVKLVLSRGRRPAKKR